MKKKLLLIFVIYLNINYICLSQSQDGKSNKAETAQVEYITKQLTLTPEESQKFWPIYNNYKNEIKNIKRDNKGGDEIEVEEKVLNIRKKYKDDFKAVLGSDERVNKLFVAEKTFREMLRKELLERKIDKQQDNQ